MKRLLFVLLAISCIGITVPTAQMRVTPVDEMQGHVALGLALRHLGNAGIFMMTTAHPDDENNGLLVMLNRGQGYRTTLATATRGNGGQNEIGPEIFEALGVLRTEELHALHRFDGAEQYFTRAVDFGFSFSVEETLEKWGHDEVLGDFVRLIRTIRPDVMAGLSTTGVGGGQHHQTSARLAAEAFKIANDPTKYPEQIREGLHPWQPKKIYFMTNFGGPADPNAVQPARTVNIDLSGYDDLLGKTYTEIGTEARSMHKCQGMAQLLSLPGPVSSTYYLADTVLADQRTRDERTLFDGVDSSLNGLAQFAGAQAPKELTDGLASLSTSVQAAQRAFDADNDAAVMQPLTAGLRALRTLRSQLATMNGLNDSARYEIDYRLGQKEQEFQQALLLANNVRVETLADDGVVVPGQSVKVTAIVANRGSADVAVKQVSFVGFDAPGACALTEVASANIFGQAGPGGGRGGQARPAPRLLSTLKRNQVAQCAPSMTVPASARATEPYWHRAGDAGRYTFDTDAPFGLPYRPTPFTAKITMTLGTGADAIDVTDSGPVLYRYEGNIFSGEKRSELLVVPAASVHVSPEIAIIPSASIPAAARTTATAARAPRQAAGREVRVTVTNDVKGASESTVRLELPNGWTATPAQDVVKFAREDETQTVRFTVRPPAGAAAGEYHVKAVVTSGNNTFDRGYQVIEYPHIRRAHIYRTADVVLKVIDVRVAPNVKIGYIMGVGDEVPPALEQLGVNVEMLDADDLAWGDLSKFTTIITGVRAYERRGDLRANNSRLLEYVEKGGTLIVQYNKFEFNQAQYGPYPAKVSSERATDEYAPVRALDPDSPLLITPNRVDTNTWKGWVQERGLYFLGDRDPRYKDLVAIDEPFAYNKGEKRGALVEADYGRGRWVYVGLGLWRELPAGVDGAYQLLANLVSLSATPLPPAKR
ncbi:MAG: PIG-L family deacetylase [Vicinamibacterales bacterium]